MLPLFLFSTHFETKHCNRYDSIAFQRDSVVIDSKTTFYPDPNTNPYRHETPP